MRRFADLFSREQLDALREAEEARVGRRARAALPAAQDLRVGPRLGRARRARGRAREPAARGARHVPGRGDAAPERAGPARGAAVVRGSRGARRDPGRGERAVQRRPARADARRRGARRRLLGHRRSDRAERGGEGDLAARALEGARSRRATLATRASARCARRGSRGCSATTVPTIPSSYHTAYMRRLSPLESTYTKDRATEICLRDARGARLRPERTAEHQARSRRPAAEVAARVCDRERPAEGRAPDHARAGRAARLPGVPARGGARAALRGLRPRPAVHVPAHLARPRADRDLLVHRRGDLARAGVARALFRPRRPSRRARTPRRRRSSRRCSIARYEAKLRYELDFWSRFNGDGGDADVYERLLTEATGIRYRKDNYLSDMDAGLLLGRLPPGLDPLGAARAHLIDDVGEDWWRNPAPASCCATCSAKARSRRARDRRPARLRPVRHGAAAARNRRLIHHCRDGADA